MIRRLFVYSLLVLGVAGCGVEDNSDQSNTTQGTIHIEIIDANKNSVIKELGFKSDQMLMKVLKHNFEVSENAGFLNSIDNVIVDRKNKEFIATYINGKKTMKGADELRLTDGDKFELVIEKWE